MDYTLFRSQKFVNDLPSDLFSDVHRKKDLSFRQKEMDIRKEKLDVEESKFEVFDVG